MYQPRLFKNGDDASIDALITEHPFASLITVEGGIPNANHLPLMLERDASGGRVLVGHMARANPQWRAFDGKTSALAIFHGPQCYISPSIYSPGVHVPTWNYAVVHAQGIPVVIEERVAMETMMHTLVQRHEGVREAPWKLALSEADWTDFLGAIVGFRMPVTQLDAKFKLSQNRLPEDRERVTQALSASTHPDELRVGQLMRKG